MDKEQLLAYGINYDRGLKNCMGRESFYFKILTMFLKDTCFPRARVAFAKRNYKDLFSSLHELKGVSGTAGLIPLCESIIPIIELLRSKTFDYSCIRDGDVDELFLKADKEYDKVIKGINLFVASR